MGFFQNLIRHLLVPKHFKKAGPQSMFNPYSYLVPKPADKQKGGTALSQVHLFQG